MHESKRSSNMHCCIIHHIFLHLVSQSISCKELCVTIHILQHHKVAIVNLYWYTVYTYLINRYTHSKPQSLQRKKSYTLYYTSTCVLCANIQATLWNSRENPQLWGSVMFNAEVGSTALYLLSSSAEPSALQSFPSYQSFCAMQKYPISVITVHLHFRNFSAEQQWHNLLMVHLFKNSTFLPQFHQTVFQATCYLQWNTVCYTSWRSNCLQSYFHSLRKNKSFMDCSFLSGHLSLIFKGYLLKFYMNWAIQLSAHKTKS